MGLGLHVGGPTTQFLTKIIYPVILGERFAARDESYFPTNYMRSRAGGLEPQNHQNHRGSY